VPLGCVSFTVSFEGLSGREGGLVACLDPRREYRAQNGTKVSVATSDP
jgi:hypothetical protein